MTIALGGFNVLDNGRDLSNASWTARRVEYTASCYYKLQGETEWRRFVQVVPEPINPSGILELLKHHCKPHALISCAYYPQLEAGVGPAMPYLRPGWVSNIKPPTTPPFCITPLALSIIRSFT